MKPTKRRPYIKEIKSTWWTKSAFYSFYMLREATAIPAVWISLVLLFGLGALGRGPESFDNYVSFLANPIVLIVNAISLLLALLHTKTWFSLAPKAIRIDAKKECTMRLGLWAVTAVVTIVLFALAL